jgi:hypothetical protein
MRPCFHLVIKTASGQATTLFSSAGTRQQMQKEKSGYGVGSHLQRDSKGFRPIVKTTEIEMKSRNKMSGGSEEDIDIEVLPKDRFGYAL